MASFDDILSGAKGADGQIDLKISSEGLSAVTDIYKLSFKAQSMDLNSYINSHRVFDTDALLVDTVSIRFLQSLDDSHIKSVVSFVEEIAPVLIRNLTPVELGVGDEAIVVPEKVLVDLYELTDGTKVYMESYHNGKIELGSGISSEICHVFNITVGIAENNLVFTTDKGLSQRFDTVDESSIEVVKGPFEEQESLLDDFGIFPELRPRDFIVLGLDMVTENEKAFRPTLTMPVAAANEFLFGGTKHNATLNDEDSIESNKPFSDDATVDDAFCITADKIVALPEVGFKQHFYVPWAHYGRITRIPLPEAIGKEVETSHPDDKASLSDFIFVRKKLSRLWHSLVSITDSASSEYQKPAMDEVVTSDLMANYVEHGISQRFGFHHGAAKESIREDGSLAGTMTGIAALRDNVQIGKLLAFGVSAEIEVGSCKTTCVEKLFLEPMGFTTDIASGMKKSVFDVTHVLHDSIVIGRYKQFLDQLAVLDDVDIKLLAFGVSAEIEVGSCKTTCVEKLFLEPMGFTTDIASGMKKSVFDVTHVLHDSIVIGRYKQFLDQLAVLDDVDITAIMSRPMFDSFGYRNDCATASFKSVADNIMLDTPVSVQPMKIASSNVIYSHAFEYEAETGLTDDLGWDSEINIYGLKQKPLVDSFGFRYEQVEVVYKGAEVS